MASTCEPGERFAERHGLDADIRLVSDDGVLHEAAAIDISAWGLGIDGLLHFAPETQLTVESPGGIKSFR